MTIRPALAAALALIAGVAHAAPFNTLTGAEPLIWAHRGSSLLSRENTLEAFQLAADQGADGFEVDLVLTADNQLAVFHDLTLNARTNVEDVFPDRARPTDGLHHVRDFTMDELRLLEVDAPRDAVIRDNPLNPVAVDAAKVFRIPTYAEALDLAAANPGVKVLTEVKVIDDADPVERGAIIDALSAEWTARGIDAADGPVQVQSFGYNFMQAIDDRLEADGAAIKTFFLDFQFLAANAATAVDEASTAALIGALFGDLDGIALNINLFDVPGAPFFGQVNPNGVDVAAAAHLAGKEIYVWTLGALSGEALDAYLASLNGGPAFEDPQYAALFALGLDGVITDTPDVGLTARADFAAAVIPLPAAGWLLLGGLGALAALRRRG